MKITNIEAIVIREPRRLFNGGSALVTDSRERAALIAVHSDDGLVGYGEANADPQAIQALIDSTDGLAGGWDNGIRTSLLGEDPRDPRRLWTRMATTTQWSCRTGLGHVARAGVDMALWDLAGKILEVPVWQLLGTRRNAELRPYITVYHGPGRFRETLARTLDAVGRVRAAGFDAAKVETLLDNAPDERDALQLVTEVREHVGGEFTLLLDVGYRWQGFEQAKTFCREIDNLDLALIEAPFPPDRVKDYRRLREEIATPVAGCEILTAAVDYLPLIQGDALDILQAGACRTGISDMDLMAGMLARAGRSLVPWGWCATALTTAANLHLAVVHPNVPQLEYAPPSLYPDGLLRTHLAGPEPRLQDGRFEVPTAPGLGVEIDPDVLAAVRAA